MTIKEFIKGVKKLGPWTFKGDSIRHSHTQNCPIVVLAKHKTNKRFLNQDYWNAGAAIGLTTQDRDAIIDAVDGHSTPMGISLRAKLIDELKPE